MVFHQMGHIFRNMAPFDEIQYAYRKTFFLHFEKEKGGLVFVQRYFCAEDYLLIVDVSSLNKIFTIDQDILRKNVSKIKHQKVQEPPQDEGES